MDEGRHEFSYRELADGLLYQHDGSTANDDFILLQASDATDTKTSLLSVVVEVSDSLLTRIIVHTMVC